MGQNQIQNFHCVNSVCIRSFSTPYISVFGYFSRSDSSELKAVNYFR